MRFVNIPLFLSILFLASCVTQKKYDELLHSKSRVDRENLRLQQVEKDYKALQEEMASTEEQLAKTEEVLMQIKDKYLNLEGNYADLQGQYDELLDDNAKLLAAASQEKAELTQLLASKERELDDKERELRRLENTLFTKEDALAEREKSIRELNEQLNAQQERLKALRKTISDALLGFSDTDLTVEHKNGKIYVSMSQNLLFAKNSDKIDPAGKDALAKLASVLKNSPDVDIMVEGHTDTDGSAAYNWDLSVNRATAVVKELEKNGLNGNRMTASGRAYYAPVDTNDNEAGMARNRRTEIILSPKLDRLLELIGSEGESAEQ
jgi:chemotaxis protein MotB